jgi:hypothetical protein
MTVQKAQGRTIDKVVLDMHYKSNHRKRLRFDGIFVTLSRGRYTHTPALKKLVDTFQDSSQLLM